MWNCHLATRPLVNAFGKIPDTIEKGEIIPPPPYLLSLPPYTTKFKILIQIPSWLILALLFVNIFNSWTPSAACFIPLGLLWTVCCLLYPPRVVMNRLLLTLSPKGCYEPSVAYFIPLGLLWTICWLLITLGLLWTVCCLLHHPWDFMNLFW